MIHRKTRLAIFTDRDHWSILWVLNFKKSEKFEFLKSVAAVCIWAVRYLLVYFWC